MEMIKPQFLRSVNSLAFVVVDIHLYRKIKAVEVQLLCTKVTKVEVLTC